MQDIGGARVICKNIEDVKKIEELLNTKDKRFKYKFVRKKDYILRPKSSGYCGVHLIYKYINDDKESVGYNSNGLSIELQIRTQLQHIWATAVEVVGIFQQEDLKSSIGNTETLSFFALCSSALLYLKKATELNGILL
jgi:putative GTP pyrophosphokinase